MPDTAIPTKVDVLIQIPTFDRIKLLSIHMMNNSKFQDIHIAHMSDKYDTAFGPSSRYGFLLINPINLLG